VAKLTNEILSKLTTSIDKNVAALVANPVSALQLQRGFKNVDIKKSYRALVLKYHPGEADEYDITMFVGSCLPCLLCADKNPDCDTSCIFTTIQTAYEKLKVPSEPTATTWTKQSAWASTTEPTKPAHAYSQSNEYYYSKSHKPQDTNYHTSSTKNSSAKTSTAASSSNTGTSQQKDKPATDRYESSTFSTFTTAELREKLRKGFADTAATDDMSRERLLKRCLVLHNHVQTQLKRQREGLPFDSEFCAVYMSVFGDGNSTGSNNNNANGRSSENSGANTGARKNSAGSTNNSSTPKYASAFYNNNDNSKQAKRSNQERSSTSKDDVTGNWTDDFRKEMDKDDAYSSKQRQPQQQVRWHVPC
jgi:hypothetical protein